jgi:D-alanyl-D-alanine carboxypeptidase (penicillin-binding protein 5/6)
MAKELLTKYPKVMDYSKIWMDTFRDGKFRLDNTNMLVNYYNGTTGLKTGFTSQAGYCLTATAQRGDKHFISVVLGEPDSNHRFAEARKLLDNGFSNYNKVQVVKKADDTGLIYIEKGKVKNIGTHALKDLAVMLKDDEVAKVKKEIILDKSVIAPVEKGTKVGEIIVKLDGKEIVKTQIVTNDKVEKASFFTLIIRKIASWFGLTA